VTAIPYINIARYGGSVTNNNGFYIGYFALLVLLYNYKTRSIPYWTTSVFSSAVTDLVLIYESVTSSAFVVR
jgi:hypothetical protein